MSASGTIRRAWTQRFILGVSASVHGRRCYGPEMTDDEDEDSVDAMSGLAGAVSAVAKSPQAKESSRLLGRVLGPAADEIGEALRRYTSLRVENVGRVVEKANEKGDFSREGMVPPRLAHRLLEEGSYCDDELMAEYFGGLLAAGRTLDGRDDRAVVWSDVVANMSVLQIRAHLILYREWSVRLSGRSDVALPMAAGRREVLMHVDLLEFLDIANEGSGIGDEDAITHILHGLIRADLLGDYYAYGPRANLNVETDYPAPLIVMPSGSGMELYGWAQGVAGMGPHNFIDRSESIAEDYIPRLTRVSLPGLSDPPSVGGRSD